MSRTKGGRAPTSPALTPGEHRNRQGRGRTSADEGRESSNLTGADPGGAQEPAGEGKKANRAGEAGREKGSVTPALGLVLGLPRRVGWG
jgi:hypothetical protein